MRKKVNEQLEDRLYELYREFCSKKNKFTRLTIEEASNSLRLNPEEHISDFLHLVSHSNKQELVGASAILLALLNLKSSAHVLKKRLKKRGNWGMTYLLISYALLRLRDPGIIEFIKKMIRSPYCHRDLRLDYAELLTELGFKKVFGSNEKINLGGKTMTPQWSEKLSKLITQLS